MIIIQEYTRWFNKRPNLTLLIRNAFIEKALGNERGEDYLEVLRAFKSIKIKQRKEIIKKFDSVYDKVNKWEDVLVSVIEFYGR